MQLALEQARQAMARDEVPVGAVVVQNGQVIGQGFNVCIAEHDPTGHAEIQAIRSACSAVANYRLGGATLYVTLEPCVMCIGAILNARLARVVFGAHDIKAGACGSVIDMPREPLLNHHTSIESGLMAEHATELLQQFFKSRRPDATLRLERIRHIRDIPSLDKTLIAALETAGFAEPVNLRTLDALAFFKHHHADHGLLAKHLAMLLALEDFVAGQPINSWTDYQPRARELLLAAGLSL